ncbi:MAG: urate hydroxylase PuuD [Halobacteriales archaeon]|nr:urate hydroxylase PuuD [Halobacteriales archaeon]
MADATTTGLAALRWLHILFGITWIGLLYFFNFVQPRILKAIPDDQKKRVTVSILKPGLWFFRYAALGTWLAGVIYLGWWWNTAGWSVGIASIVAGGLLGTFMFLNVWGVIWRNQKKNIAALEANLASGAPMPPEAALWVKRATFASRTNTILSFPMLFFMIAQSHLGGVWG